MRTSLNDIRDIERYIRGMMEEDEEVHFEERLRRDAVLRLNLFFYEKVMVLIRTYHRKKLKVELEAVHERLIGDPLKVTFKERVKKIFGDN